PDPAATGGRFIPTRVGRGRTASRGGAAAPVHPHSRGEREHAIVRIGQSYGSSPLAWGEGERPRELAREDLVHPHSRGERALIKVGSHYLHGSSPLAWGEAAHPVRVG